MDIKHIYQPTGNSCGPTCLKMVGDFLKGDVGKISDLCRACGTDWVVGTPPERMKKGLNYLNINHVEHMGEKDPFTSLRNVIDRGNVAIVRTITRGIPHWIVIVGYNQDKLKVHDPWLGEIEYTDEELDEIWRVRDHFYYEIIGSVSSEEIKIEKIKNEHIPIIQDSLPFVFKKTGMTKRSIWFLVKHFDRELSFVAMDGSSVAGFYLIGRGQIPKGGEDYEMLKKMKGVEGIGLGVLPGYENKGIGKMLISHSQELPVDYIWGYQLKTLENIDHWLKRRKIYVETDDLYITYQLLNN